MSFIFKRIKPNIKLLITRSDPQEPSGPKRSRLTLKWRRAKKKEEERAKREKIEREEAERARQVQEKQDLEIAIGIQEEPELDSNPRDEGEPNADTGSSTGQSSCDLREKRPTLDGNKKALHTKQKR